MTGGVTSGEFPQTTMGAGRERGGRRRAVCLWALEVLWLVIGVPLVE